ncbi:hypothetical protein K1719_041174 [Acacia pycnantha]|nr:hypothetical protein K1719_041174 [Acacia pycnantha]
MARLKPMTLRHFLVDKDVGRAKSLFKELDEFQKLEVTLGHNKHIQAKSKGIVSIVIIQENAKIAHDVMHATTLSHNLLSAG